MSISPGTTTSPRGTSRPSAPSTGRSRADLRDPPVLDQDVERRRPDPVRRIDHPAALDQQLHHCASSCSAGEQVEHRHPHRDAVGDLLEDHRVGAVGDLRLDLDAAVHRPRVHDDHVRLGALRAARRSARRALKYSRSDGMKCALHPLVLDAQHHDDVGAVDRLVDRCRRRARRSRSMPGGISVGGPHTHTSAPSLFSSWMFERSTRLCSRSPTIATFSPSMPLLVLADGEGVEQRLRRMLVHAVAGVDDAPTGRSARAGAARRTRRGA